MAARAAQEKVQALVRGVMEGYTRLTALDGTEKAREYEAVDGVLDCKMKVVRKLEISGSLRELVEKTAGCTFGKPLYFTHPLETGVSSMDPEDVEEALKQYEEKADVAKEQFAKQVDDAKANQKKRAERIVAALNRLKAAKAEKDLAKIKDAVKNVAQVMQWNTGVDVAALLVGLRGMMRLAKVAAVSGHREAWDVLKYLQSVAREGPGFWITTRGSMIGYYQGQLDIDIIAEDILRQL